MLAFIWGIPAMAAFTPGRDYHPSVAFDGATDTANSMKLALSNALILDALNAGESVAAGSNFGCSDFEDDTDAGWDPDTAVDYGQEDTLDCQSPTDNTEY